MKKLTKELSEQLKKSSELDKEIRKNLKSIGYNVGKIGDRGLYMEHYQTNELELY